MNKKLKTILAAGFLVAGMAAQACTLAAWDNTTGTAVGGGPSDANIIPRYSGLCSMEVTTTGSVINNGTGPLGNGVGAAISGPAAEATMITRFYFRASGPAGSSATLFETYDGEVPGAGGVNPVYTVTYDTTNVTVTPAGGTPAVAPVSATKQWHSVEVRWASGNGTTGGAIDVWVDSDALTAATSDASTTSVAAATSIQAVQLGGITNSGFTQILIDDYESRRSTSIGRLMVGDASGDGIIDITDVTTIVDEVFGTPSGGTPDCDENGIIDISDVTCAVDLIFAP